MPENVPLDGGLDLVTARPAVKPGRLQACLNYEVGWVRGYARIDGFERFDGNISPSVASGWVVTVPKKQITGTFTTPEELSWQDSDEQTKDAGVLVETQEEGENLNLFVAYRPGRKHPRDMATITGDTSGASFVLDDTKTAKEEFYQHYDSQEEYQDALGVFADTLRQQVKSVPGTGIIVGLHFHEDALYAVRDGLRMTVSDADAAKITPGAYVYNDNEQVAEVASVETTTTPTGKVNTVVLMPITPSGFAASAGDALHLGYVARFRDGKGIFNPGDAVTASLSGWAGNIGAVVPLVGSFSAGDTKGIVILIGPAGPALQASDVVTAPAGTFTIVRPDIQLPARSAVTVASTFGQAEYAGLWRSTPQGWQPAPIGRTIKFSKGTTDPGNPPLLVYAHVPTAGGRPATSLRMEISHVDVATGTWDKDDASGHFSLVDWAVPAVPAGTKIYTQPLGAGDLVATADGPLTYPLLPGSLLLGPERSRYQMLSYNFFASEDRNAVYGVSGAGPAFTYDGKVLDFVTTGLDKEHEKPRHVAVHENRLALGYAWGEVYLSEPGEPMGFDATLFAGSFAFGDRITGLMPIAGRALAVFTESSIHALVGAPGSDAEQRVINHRVGAIEYTVQSTGTRPIFASFRGIETIETNDEYSEFNTAPLSYDVSPWLLRRLQTAVGVEAADEAVVNSVVVRNKNQYRLLFGDGYVLTLTLVGQEREPQCTLQRYWFDALEQDYFRCYATASGVTRDGRDRAFVSAEPPYDMQTKKLATSAEFDFVYELDRGRSFDGQAIRSEFTVSQFFSDTPPLIKRFNIIQVHGLAQGYAGLRFAQAANYEDLDDPDLPHEDMAFGALTLPAEGEPHPKYTKARVSGRGFAVSVNVTHKSAVEFPHVVQLMTFLDDEPIKPNR